MSNIRSCIACHDDFIPLDFRRWLSDQLHRELDAVASVDAVRRHLLGEGRSEANLSLVFPIRKYFRYCI